MAAIVALVPAPCFLHNARENCETSAFEGLGRTGFGREGHMGANRHGPIDFESPVALRVWCIVAGLALAPLPVVHAMPAEFLYIVFGRPSPNWNGLTLSETYWFTIFGVPLVPIFLAWSLPGASRPGLPMRSIVVLCLLVAYHPIRLHVESHDYGVVVARLVTEISRGLPLIWTIRHLDTPLLIGLAATALLRHYAIRPLQKVLFHWIRFVCARWAAGPLYDIYFYLLQLLSSFAS